MLVPHLGNLAFGGSCICSGLVLDGSECIPGTVQLAFELRRAEVVEIQQNGEDHLPIMELHSATKVLAEHVPKYYTISECCRSVARQ